MKRARWVLGVKLMVLVLALAGLTTCRLHLFSNPLDPDSEDYIGRESLDSDGDGIGQWEDVDEVVGRSPADGATVNTLTPTVSVVEFNPQKVKRYWIQVSLSGSRFESGMVFTKDDYPSHECAIPSGKLENGTRYYWRAKAFDGVKWSDDWSEIWTFEVSLVIVNPTSGLVTTEAGGTASFTVVLASQPTANVTVGLRSSAG